MNKKIISILTLIIFVLCQLPAFAAAPTVTITSPQANGQYESTEVVLSVTASDSEEVRFILDNEEIAKFEGSGDFEYVIEKADFGNHTFKAVAIAQGQTLRQVQVNFSVRDYFESEVRNTDCNDFDGASIATAGFAGFQQNIDTTGTPNGKLALGEGPDGSVCVRLQAAKKNNTNLYLPFINFALPSTNKDVYIFEQDILVSDANMRYSYEIGGTANLIMDSKVGSLTLEPGVWYKLRAEFDFALGNLDLYVDDELVSTVSLSNTLTKTEVRVLWASREAEDGYVLLDNFVVRRRVSTPVVGKTEYLKEGVWTEFTTEVPFGAEQIKLTPDASMTVASKDSFKFYQNNEEIAVDYEITSDGSFVITPEEILTAGSKCRAEYNSGSLGGVLSASFLVGGGDVYAMSVTFNAGKYQAQYRSQLTDESKVSARVIVSNRTDEAKPVFIITAVYKNGMMTSCAAASGTANANGIGIVSVPQVNADSGDEIVSYIIDSWENRIPIAEAGRLLD